MIKEKYKVKYKSIIEACQLLKISDREINDRIYMLELLDGYKAITYTELEFMSQSDLDNLISVCWRDGKYRCDCIGVSNVHFERIESFGKRYINVSFSDADGDPELTCYNINSEIDNVGDGEWNYGLYKKIKND
jgi:hypothetical protein